MSERNDFDRPADDRPDEPQPLFEDDRVPVEEEDAVEAPEHPRRAASAEFIVEHEAPSASVLREAMDPANQSLTDALKLSYRVLQFVIVILVVLFLISGFKTVEESQTGVKTLFGQIQGGAAETAVLQPGLEVSLWPYPAAEFIVFPASGAVGLNDVFWPDAQINGNGGSYEAAKESVEFHDPMTPGLGAGKDGMVLIADGLAHLQLQATYEVSDPVQFVNQISGADAASRLVRIALQRGAIHATSDLRLDDMIDQEDIIAENIRTRAQEYLRDLQCGIRISRVQATNVRPPLAIAKTLQNLNTARTQASQRRAEAVREKNTQLVRAAGQNYQRLLDLIEQYERILIEQSEPGMRNPEAESILRSIDALLVSEEIGGEVAQMISSARAYRDTIQSTLGAYARRFKALWPAYQANPEFVVRRQWLDSYRRVLTRGDAESFHIPGQTGSIDVAITSSSDVMLKRREMSQERRTREAQEATGLGRLGEYQPRLGERDINRRLRITEEGEITGRRRNQ